jgi:hypothetical protein
MTVTGWQGAVLKEGDRVQDHITGAYGTIRSVSDNLAAHGEDDWAAVHWDDDKVTETGAWHLRRVD